MFPPTNDNMIPLPQDGAMDELFAQHYKASLHTAYRMLRSKEDAQDAVQSAYCAAFKNFEKFRRESSFKTWITRIVVNCCLMQMRERRASRRIALDDILPVLESHAPTPEALCYQTELQTAHSKAASRLPKILREVYVESEISGVAFADLAEQLGLTAAAAKSRLLRARRRVEHAFQFAVQRSAAL
jgi:RNA polymerase sigma-70 factor (ECF subfamily)